MFTESHTSRENISEKNIIGNFFSFMQSYSVNTILIYPKGMPKIIEKYRERENDNQTIASVHFLFHV